MKKHYLITTLIFTLTMITNSFANGGKDGKAQKNDQEKKESRPAQVTFITPLGTNGIEAPEISNKFSLNILTGVNGGLNGVEVGGMVNVILGEVEGAQFAGFGNYVHEETHGAQFGGMFNVSKEYLEGGQFAGLVNVALDEGKGTQIAGLVNVNHGSFSGFQAGGLVNVTTKEMEGLQAAGLVNYSGGDITSGQLGGLVNVGLGNTNGIQIAGLTNVSGKSHKGSQFAGLINVATEEVTGSQISGIINYSERVSGVQIGLINVSDSVGGVQLGLFSFAGNGYIGLGIESNETFQGQLTYKMGLKKLYNIYAVAGTEGDNRYWAPGFGLGTFLIDGNKVSLNLEGMAYQVNEDEWWTNKLNMLARLNLNFQYHITRGFSFVAGASINEAISQVRDAEGELVGGSFIPKWTFHEHKGKKTMTTLYPGFNVGIEFKLK